MITVQNLIEIDHIPEETDVSLGLLVDFYEKYLCKYIFLFELANGESVKLIFRDATEVFHVSGIEHIYSGNVMNGRRFLEGIKTGTVDLNSVRNINPNAYKDFELRIRSMFCIDTIIKKCEYLLFANGKIPETDIPVRYLLFKGLDGKNIHLGIDTYKMGRPYFARTLLVTDGGQKEKFIDRADKRLRVLNIQIKEKDTDKVVQTIAREKATFLAKDMVKQVADEWLHKEFVRIIEEYISKTAESNDFASAKAGVSRKQYSEWKHLLMEFIQKQKPLMVERVEKLDPYWAAKLVGEAIREYDKSSLHKIQNSIDNFINRKVTS